MAYHPLPITWYVIFYILGIFYYPDHQNQWTPDFHFIERQWPCWTEEGKKAKQNLAKKREKLWWWLWERALLCNKFSIGQKRLLFIFLFSFIFFDSHEQTSIVMPTLAVQMGTRKCVRLRGWTKQRLKQYNAHKNTFQEKSTTSLFTLPTT